MDNPTATFDRERARHRQRPSAFAEVLDSALRGDIATAITLTRRESLGDDVENVLRRVR